MGKFYHDAIALKCWSLRRSSTNRRRCDSLAILGQLNSLVDLNYPSRP
jgi:hypothetical protein